MSTKFLHWDYGRLLVVLLPRLVGLFPLHVLLFVKLLVCLLQVWPEVQHLLPHQVYGAQSIEEGD